LLQEIARHIFFVPFRSLITFVLNRALPIVRALEHGADVVVTGRCTDSALALGPLMFEVK